MQVIATKRNSDYKPKRILFLAGIDWAEPFITAMDVETAKNTEQQYVEAVGKLDVSKEQQSCIVVAAHPQSRKEGVWVEEVVDAFEKC